ncbi:MAG: OsmC family protein [Chloroflexi bacterium]|nr:OsmC family protein [Chloroflexota bacterium]
MSTIKTVHLTAKQVDGFKIEAKARNHAMIIDQPEAGGGSDGGPTPLEYQFASLASCVITIGHIIARQRRLPVRDIGVDIEGNLDTEVFLGKSTTARAGFTGIKVCVSVDADMTQAEKDQFVADIDRRCPISDNVHNTTPITFVVS